MSRLGFVRVLGAGFLMACLWAGLAVSQAMAGGNPYCPKCNAGGSGASSAQSSAQESSSGGGGGNIFLTPGSSSSGGGAQPFYLQGILNNPTSAKYGMHYSVSTPAQPFSMNGGGGAKAEKYPTVDELQAMAQKDQEANLKSALVESADRTRQIQEMQEEWAKQMQKTSAQGAGSGDSSSSVKYFYKKSDPTKLSAPARVFLDNR